MSARKKLYEITTIEGEVVEPSISIQECNMYWIHVQRMTGT